MLELQHISFGVEQDGARKDILPGLLDSSSSVCSALSDKVR